MSPEAPQMVANKNVEQIAKLESQQVGARTLSERIAGHLCYRAPGLVRGLDPPECRHRPPPPTLTFLSIWILISQNQMSRQADRREHLGLQLTLLAEQESTATLRLVRQIAERLGVSVVDSESGARGRDLSGPTRHHDGRGLARIARKRGPTAPGIPARMTATHHPPEDTT